VPVGQVFGGNTSAQNWEGIARAREYLAEHLSSPASSHLLHKHKDILNLIQFSDPPTTSTRFTRAVPDDTHTGVLDTSGSPVNTPHNTFVDDNTIAEVRPRMRQAMAASAESLFHLIGHPDTTQRRSPLSMEKYYQAQCSHVKKQLGYLIDTRTMTVSFPTEKFNLITSTLSHWHAKRKKYTLKEAATLAGCLEFFASISTWIRFITTSLKHSILIGLRQNTKLIHKNKKFSSLLNDATQKHTPTLDSVLRKNFAFSKILKATWNCKQQFFISQTLRQELKFLLHIFNNHKKFKLYAPISHLIGRTADFTALGDACLDGAGGYSEKLHFWWFVPWPQHIRERTIKYSNKKYKSIDNTILSINLLEYIAILISFSAAIMAVSSTPSNPYPLIEILSDNRSAISWTKKAASSSREGKNLSLIFTSLLLKSPLGLQSSYIPGTMNTVADHISRMQTTNKRISFSKLSQAYPTLQACKRFHPNHNFLSLIWEALLSPHQFSLPTIKTLGHLSRASNTG